MRWNRGDEAVRPDSHNRRSETRRESAGEVVFFFEDPLELEVRGVVTDDSASGFRAQHNYSNLETGQVVRFRRSIASGKAKVVWTRISGVKVETGFLVL